MTSLITYTKTHPHVSSIELQGIPLGMRNGTPKSLNALARLLSERHIQFLGLTGIGLEEFDGRLLLGTPLPATLDELEILDLTQN